MQWSIKEKELHKNYDDILNGILLKLNEYTAVKKVDLRKEFEEDGNITSILSKIGIRQVYKKKVGKV